MIIRGMIEDDIGEVIKIENDTFSRPWKIHDFLSSIESESNIYLIVEEDGRVVAYCGLWGLVGEGHINNVAVDKEYQNKGIAFKMLRELIERGRKKGIRAFTLEVRKSNDKAIHIYEKLGFVKIGMRKRFYENPIEDAVVMWLY